MSCFFKLFACCESNIQKTNEEEKSETQIALNKPPSFAPRSVSRLETLEKVAQDKRGSREANQLLIIAQPEEESLPPPTPFLGPARSTRQTLKQTQDELQPDNQTGGLDGNTSKPNGLKVNQVGNDQKRKQRDDDYEKKSSIRDKDRPPPQMEIATGRDSEHSELAAGIIRSMLTSHNN
eukprot:TRINITY_DN10661_c0_g4_i1.p1 TRINITY_DN10661_c0_g4~~TRINITY_DN10661_c0_g4_i1.p1  ORF type:complete len:179 (-),score=31.91 TRINITY_DN10661_c0_g4_i1:235-771(-)